ncbi:flagellar basal-body MS-ring/collar protein FliF [Methylobacillus pratensis]
MLDQLKNQWQQSSLAKRFVVLLGLLAVVGLLAGGTYWSFKEDYQVLFSDLNGQDASAMVTELDRLKVPYQLADDGATILVEASEVYKTRLKLMGKGLNLNGSVGFEIFNNSEFGMTEFAQKVNYQRALQGELARTIMAFDEVKAARVHLVLPESGLFRRQNSKPKASVSIHLKDGNMLSPEQVFGIQRLVAASVAEITPAEVTVVDHHGVAVTKQLVGPQAEAALHERLDIKKQLEDYMARKVVNVVDRVFGPGKAIVSVDVALNYDQVKVTREDVVPLPETSGQEVGAIVRRKESIQGEEQWDSVNNIQTQERANRWMPNSTQTEVEYLNSKRVEQVLSAPGNVARLNVGVLVPETEDKVKLAKLKEMISMVAGIDASRGDGVVVYGVDMMQAQALPESTNNVGGSDAEEWAGQEALQKQEVAAGAISSIKVWQWIAGLVVILLAGIALMQSRKPQKSRLTAAQRSQLLAELNEWVNHARQP